MKPIHVLLTAVAFCGLVICCNKYQSLNGNITISGYTYITDTVSAAVSLPVSQQPLYLNAGADTTTYLYQLQTDSSGSFSIHYLQKNNNYVLFTRFIKNNTVYAGSVKMNSVQNNAGATTTLNVYPQYTNGMGVTFTDTLGEIIQYLPFRIYNSRIMAKADSIKYAWVNTQSDLNGQFIRYNIVPGKYYIVSADSLGLLKLVVFDSVTVKAAYTSKKTVLLHE